MLHASSWNINTMSKQLSRCRVSSSNAPQGVEVGVQVEVLRGWVTRGNLLANSESLRQKQTNGICILSIVFADRYSAKFHTFIILGNVYTQAYQYTQAYVHVKAYFMGLFLRLVNYYTGVLQISRYTIIKWFKFCHLQLL